MTWAHAVNSLDKLTAALQSSAVDSIEADVVMSFDDTSTTEPILAHPPQRSSDLSLKRMLQSVTKETCHDDFGVADERTSALPSSNHTAAENPKSDRNRILERNLKLDFKEIAALNPSIQVLQDCCLINPLNKSIILNADILPGPGRRDTDPNMVPAAEFIEACLEYIRSTEERKNNANLKFALSLGYKCDWSHHEGYTVDDATAMKRLVESHHLPAVKNTSIVLALNARILSRALSIFDDFLRLYATSSILAWTGSGEPPIPRAEVDKIDSYYAGKGMQHRIEFDCNCCEQQK